MTETHSSDEVVKYYNQFASYQKKTGANIRIKTILKNVRKLKLPPESHVLEVGCGTGNISKAIGSIFPRGKIICTDISEAAIKIAREACKKHSHVQFMNTGSLENIHEGKFDLVLFADVLEHIPISDHGAVFKSVKRLTHEKSIVAINIPSAVHIRYLQQHEPSQLQIIDQPLDTNTFLHEIYQNGFYLYSLHSYSLYFHGGDYQWIILVCDEFQKEFRKKNKWELRRQELYSRLRFL